MSGTAVTILLIEDDPGHARLIEKNIRRARVNNAIVRLADGPRHWRIWRARPGARRCWCCSTSTCPT